MEIFIIIYVFGVLLAAVCEKAICDMVKKCLFDNPDLEDSIDRSKLQPPSFALVTLIFIALIPFMGYLLAFAIMNLNEEKFKILTERAIDTINSRGEEGNEGED